MGGDASASEDSQSGDKPKSACPFAHLGAAKDVAEDAECESTWDEGARARLAKIPEGFMRDMTMQRVETYARKKGVDTITAELMDGKYAEWGEGSAKQTREMTWEEDALERARRIPDFVRGMVIKEVERCARELGFESVTTEALEKARDTWMQNGVFHSEGKPGQYSDDS